jgi:hypothetical protein
MKPLEVELSEGCMLRLYTGGRAEVVRILQGTELERLRSWARQHADVLPAPAPKKKRRRRKQRQAPAPPVGKLAPRAASMKDLANGEARAALSGPRRRRRTRRRGSRGRPGGARR